MNFFVKHIVFVFALYSNLVNAQTYFNKKIDIRNGADEGRGGIVALDSGYVICSASIYNGNIGVGLLKLNLIGDSIYTKWYGKNFTGYYCGWSGSFRKSFTNGFYMGGSFKDTATGLINFGLLYRFDKNLDTIWTKKYGDGLEDHIFYQARQTSDSGFICVGLVTNGSSAQALLLKTDSLGNEEWRTSYGGNNTEIGTTVIQTNDGGYLIGGISNSLSCNGGYDQWVLKTNSVGVMQWSKCYGGSFNDGNAILGHQYPDGDYVFVGGRNYSVADWYKNSVTRIRSNNTIEWYREFGAYESDAVLQSMKVMSNGDIIAVGNRFPYGVMVRVSETGDSLWYREFQYQSSMINNLWDLDIAVDSGFVAIGTTNDGSQDVWVIKLDKYGCLQPNCWFSEYISKPINLVGFNEFELISFFSLFPNPNNGIFSVQYELKTNEPVYLSFYNSIGQMAYSISLQDGANYQQLNLELPNGIYEWVISVDSFSVKKGKMVVIR